jgi:hypothetical protein
MTATKRTAASLRMARRTWPNLSRQALIRLREIATQHGFSVGAGDVIYLDSGWYVTHTGLLGLARRNRCAGIHVRPVSNFCDPSSQRWAFRATVYSSRTCRGFVGYGDADPSNTSPLVHGAEMRVAETRAVNRPCAKPTESASAQLRRSVLSLANPLRVLSPRSCRSLSMATGSTAAAPSAIVYAS